MGVSATLSQKPLILVFSYAPAGLGHLRVTRALYGGLPKNVIPLLIGAQDKSISVVHRIMSVHPLARNIMEWMQDGVPEWIFSTIYRWNLRRNTKVLYSQMETVLDQRIELPQTILVVATHFGLAHQMAAVKRKLAQEKNVRIVLIVQVTDDSPQHMWYVPGADITFVPSERTKLRLEKYGKIARLPKLQFEVVAYPVSPLLNEVLSRDEIENKVSQVAPSAKSTIHVAIPISGAAVGTHYFSEIIELLHQRSNRFQFEIIAKAAEYTSSFLMKMGTKQFVKLHISTHDRGTVESYERVYRHNIIALEITKPSEQAFKALINPTHQGGSLLLFSEPVGRQEYDNLDFLRRHHLMPTHYEQRILWRYSEQKRTLSNETYQHYVISAIHWRGLLLPKNPTAAANFIWWCFSEGILSAMMVARVTPERSDPNTNELNPHGVTEFWKRVTNYLNKPTT